MSDDKLFPAIEPTMMAPDDAAIAHHVIDALTALEHLRVDHARDGASASAKMRVLRAQEELQKVLALIRNDKD